MSTLPERHAMCPECAVLRPVSSIKSEPCPWCGWDPTKTARQRRVERRAQARALRRGKDT